MTVIARSWLKRSLLILVLSVLLLASGLFWALRTQSGARQVVSLVLSQLDANISVGEVSGSFVNGLTFSDINLLLDAASIHLKTVVLGVDTTALLGRSLIIRNLGIDGVTIIRSQFVADAASEQSASRFPSKLDLPIDIAVDQLRVNNVHFGGDGEVLTTIVDSLQAQATWAGTKFELTQFDTQSPFGTLSASATVTTEDAYPIQLVAKTTVLLPDMAAIHSSTQLSGTLRALEIEHSSKSPYLFSVEGVVREPLVQPDLKLLVNAAQINVREISDALPEIQVVGQLNLAGLLNDLVAAGSVSSSLPTVGQYVATFNGNISPQSLKFSSLAIEFSDIENTPELQASGEIVLADGAPAADIHLDWKRLRWPFQGERVVSSPKGSASIKGALSAYSITLLGDINTRQETDGKIELAAQGSPEQIRIDSLRVQALSGIVTGRGELSTSSGLAFVASLEGKSINPASLNTNWPGKLDFKLAGSGTATDQGITASVTNLSGQGQLRGYPVTFGGKGLIAPNGLDIKRLNVTTGDTTISAWGEVSERINLNWNLESSDLGSLWPGLKGQVNAEGEAGGTTSYPTVTFTLKGKALEYRDMAANEVEADIAFDGTSADSSISIIASGLTSGPYESQQFSVDAQGAMESHTIVIKMEDNLGKSNVRIEGKLTEFEQYDFSLDQLSLATSDLGIWSLSKPASGRATKSAISVSETCLEQDQSTLCLSLDAAQNRLAANVDITQVPLSLFSHLVPSAVRAKGTVNGGGDIVVSASGDSSGSVHFDLDPLVFESQFRKDTRDSTLQFSASTLTASIDEAGQLELTASFPLVSGGGLDFTGRIVAGQEALLERSLSGDLSVSVPSVSFVTDYISQLSQAEGQIDGVIQLAGSLRHPELLGSFELQDGALTLSDPGVQATDVTLKLVGNRNNSFTLTGGAKSGGGDITLDGILELNDEGNKGRFNLKGSSFQVLNTQESQVWASPDVSLEYQNNALNLEGTVLIPKAKVVIDALPEGASKVSKDQIIVGQTETKDSAAIPLTAELVLQLSDDVHLSAFGLDAFLGGAITIRDADNKPTTATGEIELKDGEYQAYGQKLTITTGRLVYAGGPLDEPGIDLRAIRRPTADIEVGVSARGTISQPTFSVFSEPAMSDSDQLAYLIFGRPINAEATSESTLITRAALTLGMQGGEALTQKLAGDLGVDQLGIESQESGDLSQASLVIGKYLSPELFVSYGIGLLEPVSTLKLEYALTSRWQLVTESSSTRSGADVQYTVER